MCDYRESRESWEWANLAPYASHSSDPSLSWRRSDNDKKVAAPNKPQPRRGDVHFPNMQDAHSHMPVPDLAGAVSRFKTAFQLDKERITSSTAFRRLEYKTQMFVTHEGDHYRTRLTHTIEVNETARFIAQALQLNEDLVDAIALGHDVGHTPFGHAGEDALDKLFREHWPEGEEQEVIGEELYGGAFYHNVQSVRVVDSLEKGYEWDRRPIVADNDLHNPAVARGHGLDLTWAVREGILKHSSRGLRKKNNVRMYGSDYLMAELDPFQPATLEGQVIEFADEIASMMHDLEDGLRSRLFTLGDLRNALAEHLIHTKRELKDILGLSARFIHREPGSPRIQSRVSKLLSLIHEIRTGTDCTVGTVLAVLRSIFLSNIVETSYSRLIHAMAGTTTGIFDPPSVTNEAGPDDLIWLHFDIQAPHGPLEDSYCAEAWDIDPTQRTVEIRTFHRATSNIQPVTVVQEDAQVYWYSRTTNLVETRTVIIRRQDGTVWQYPLGNVCITFGGAKLIGYDNKLLDLRKWLRGEFIPDRLHKASMVVRMNDKGQRWLEQLFELYLERPQIINRRALQRFHMWKQAHDSPAQLQAKPAFVLRIVEHLQGMTDRYLTEEYSRLFLHERTVGREEEITLVDGDESPFNRQKPRDRAVGE
jgi:dGTP triphosphohydrolase